jgi:hypothetical protein
MTKHKFIYGEPPEGTLTLGVVYHVLAIDRIRNAFECVGIGEDPPKVLGYVIVEEVQVAERFYDPEEYRDNYKERP